MRRFPRALLAALILAFAHGLLYVFVAPPWQHYDEPDHFEYAWLIANRRQALPQPGDVDRAMRIDVVRSMIRHGFYRDLGPPPDVDSPDAPTPNLGYSQLGDSPLYYFVPAAPMALLSGQSVEVQLYGGRLTSLALFVLTVTCGWGVAAALTPDRHPLRWLLPCSMALLPAFTDLMTAVNSDVGAVAAYSLFLWGSVRLMNPRGAPRRAWQTAWQAAWVIGVAVLCFQIKGTAAPALPLTAVVFLFSAFRTQRIVAWTLFALGIASMLVVLFDASDASLWYRNPTALQREPTRCDNRACDSAPVGDHAIAIVAAPNAAPPYLFQSIPPASVAMMRDQTVTIGAWMWAGRGAELNGSEPFTVEATLPLVSYNYGQFSRASAVLDETPRFVAVTATIPAIAGYVRIIAPSVSQAPDVTTTVMLDGIVLAVGEFPTSEAPRFRNALADGGEWGGRPFENLARNASGEGAWISLRPQVEQFLQRFTPGWVSWALGVASLLDPAGAGWYHRLTAEHMFQTFWARFSWGNVPMAAGWYVALAVVTAASLCCTLVALWRCKREVDWAVVAVMALSIITIWGSALMRGVFVGLEARLWLAGARYTYPAIIPVMLAFTFGWSIVIQHCLTNGNRPIAKVVASTLIVFTLVLAATSVVTIVAFYSVRT
jgi:hypothetical protein